VAEPFKQLLSGGRVAIERATERTPDDRSFFVFLDDGIVGKHRTFRGAQEQFREERDRIGWTPPQLPELSPEEKVRRDKEYAARAEYEKFWGRARPQSGGRPGKTKR
jgi:hypothetical protein